METETAAYTGAYGYYRLRTQTDAPAGMVLQYVCMAGGMLLTGYFLLVLLYRGDNTFPVSRGV